MALICFEHTLSPYKLVYASCAQSLQMSTISPSLAPPQSIRFTKSAKASFFGGC